MVESKNNAKMTFMFLFRNDTIFIKYKSINPYLVKIDYI